MGGEPLNLVLEQNFHEKWVVDKTCGGESCRVRISLWNSCLAAQDIASRTLPKDQAGEYSNRHLYQCLKACALLCSFDHESRKFPRAAKRPNSCTEPGTEPTIVVVKVRARFGASIEFIITLVCWVIFFTTLLCIDLSPQDT